MFSRRSIVLILALILLSVTSIAYPEFCFFKPSKSKAASTPVQNTDVQVFFSPRGGCTEAVVDAIGQAKTEILVQAYSFTSAPIAKALVDAHKRGVRVSAILDKSQRSEKYTSADFVAHAGIPTFIDAAHSIAHNKVMIIDKAVVITGSFNFTKAAEERNAENLLFIRSGTCAEEYRELGNT